MDAQPSFDLQVSQNRFRSAEESEMHAVVTVTARNAAPATGGTAPEAAEIVLVDCSTSMGDPGSKMVAARQATIAAIDSMRDGTRFAVVEGTHEARMTYPREERTAIATQQSKAEAADAVRRLYPNGGTAMGTWLALARRLLGAHPRSIRHAVLLTDGHNVSEAREKLDEELAACTGLFFCDARGVGDGWEPEELERIVATLGGTADAVRQEAELESDFRALMRAAMGKAVPAVRIRTSTLPGVRLRFVRQVFPAFVDLTGQVREVDPNTVDVDTGAWGEETREYHLCLDIEFADRPRRVDQRLARLDLRGEGTDGVLGPPAVVLVNWTDDPRLATLIDPRLSRYSQHAELKAAIDAGFAAYQAGDPARAAAEWARAVDLAAGLNNDRILDRLRRLIEIDAAGQARIRADVSDVDSKRVRIISGDTRGTGSPKARPEHARDTGRACPNCGRPAPPVVFCTWCGATLDGGTGRGTTQ